MNATKMFNPQKILKVVVIFSVFIVLIWIYKRVTKDYSVALQNEPWLVYGNHSARDSLTIPGHKLRYPIDNKHGIEFSYSFWLRIDDWSSKFNEWKHILHRGNESGIPLQSPGFWLYPKENKLAINMNTFYSVKESCDIDNIPLHKWVHITMVLINKKIDVYVNGVIKKSCVLQGIPKVNFENVHITKWGGFGGMLSQVRYFNYAIPYYKIESIIKQGPTSGGASCAGNNNGKPPYLSDKYHRLPDFPDNQTNSHSV
jgi:hypothetical protein